MSEKRLSDWTRHDADFLTAARGELERSCDRLDGYTLSRLNRIRHAALERPAARRRRLLLAPFGGLVTACVLALVVLSLPNGNQEALQAPAEPDLAIEDLEILTSDESLEFYADFEFYQWLADNGSAI